MDVIIRALTPLLTELIDVNKTGLWWLVIAQSKMMNGLIIAPIISQVDHQK